MVAFICVCLEVADFSLVFSCHDTVQPIRYGVCYMYVGCRDGFNVGDSFVGYPINNFVVQDLNVRLNFSYSYIVFGP